MLTTPTGRGRHGGLALVLAALGLLLVWVGSGWGTPLQPSEEQLRATTATAEPQAPPADSGKDRGKKSLKRALRRPAGVAPPKAAKPSEAHPAKSVTRQDGGKEIRVREGQEQPQP